MASYLQDSAGNGSTAVDTHPAVMPTATAENSNLMTAKNTVLTAPPHSSSSLERGMNSPLLGPLSPPTLSGSAVGDQKRDAESISEIDNNNGSSSVPNAASQQSPSLSQRTPQEKSQTPPSADLNAQRPKTGGKTPRTENSHLRRNSNSPTTSIGDGYLKLVADLRNVNDLLNVGNNSGVGGRDVMDDLTIMQRFEEMEQSAKEINQLQSSGTLDRQETQFLPTLVKSGIEMAQRRWEVKSRREEASIVVENHGKTNEILEKVQRILAETNTLSLELAERLERALNPSSEEKKEGANIPMATMGDAAMSNPDAEETAPKRVNGSNSAKSDEKASAPKPAKRAKKGSKSPSTMKTIRQSYENTFKETTTRVATKENTIKVEETKETTQTKEPIQIPPPPVYAPENNKIQFLATQPGVDKKDLDKRVSFNGNILDSIAAVPTNDAAMLEQTISGMKKSTGSSTPIASASAEAMNGIYPTMAPPMFADRPAPPDLEKALKKKKKKKDKKRKREKSILEGGICTLADNEASGPKKKKKNSLEGGSISVAGSEASGPKKKKSRSRKSEGKKSEGKQGSDLGDQSMNSPTVGDPIETKPSPSSLYACSKAPRNSPLRNNIRTIPDILASTKPKQYIIATDEHPQRIHNPLLRLPQFPDYPVGETPPIEEIPQAGELWNLANLHFGSGGVDTYPISYLARLLGFDVPETGVGQEFGGDFDAMQVGRRVDAANDVGVIPEEGTFGGRIWKNHEETDSGCELAAIDNGMHDDLKLSFCDPLWANILSSYRGYDDDDFKDAGKGFYDELSPHCLEYARERGVLSKEKEGLSEGLSFRFGDYKDEEMMNSLVKKCPWISKRGQSHFCIVAESLASPQSSSSSSVDNTDNVSQDNNKNCNDRTIIAFLQYKFCWYSAEEKRNVVSKDKEMELVMYIENLVYNDTVTAGDEAAAAETLSARKELETAKVLLTSLSLVHAARAGVWYGMMESPKRLVPFFTKYFRMSQCGGFSGSVDETADNQDALSTVPLALDIKKCHFKYAILLLEESLKLSSTLSCQKRSDDACSERMIVHLSNSASASEGMPRSKRAFSNTHKDETRSKKAHLRLVRKLDATELLTVSTAGAEGVTESPIDPSEITIPDGWNIDWNVMRSFSLGQSVAQNEVDESNKLESQGILSNNSCLAELNKKQSQLATLEFTIESTARGILSQAYYEHTEYVTGEHRSRVERDKKTLAEYEAVKIRLHEAELAWQAQLDQDMDAVCDICFDGEVTPDNQIIFCDACNVAVHQKCYGIDQIPGGNYFCRACTHFEIDKEFLAAKRRRDGTPSVKPTRHPIVCELCPRRQGAFVRVQQGAVPTKKPRWVHVGCAKWQGMNYVDEELKEEIEDLTQLKSYFKEQSIQCMLCKSGIGALHPCREEGCNNFLHLTCARSLGKCNVQHGENCEGFYDPADLDHPPWTLACPEHSIIDPEKIREGSLTTEQLVTIAKSYPPEPVPLKAFNKMNGGERKEYWSDKENLEEFFEKVLSSLDGAKCALCELAVDPTLDKQCDVCGVFSHADCCDPNRGEDGTTCFSCRFSQQNVANKRRKDYEEPRCNMCKHPNASVGPLLSAFAKPTSMKSWKGKGNVQVQNSLFGKNKFVHALCGMWNSQCTVKPNAVGDLVVDFSQIAMANGREHVSKQYRCYLCGLYTGAKAECTQKGCSIPGSSRKVTPKFHVTCARQAGLEVPADDSFSLKCFRHVDCTFVFRARLEDLREIELNRNSLKKFNASVPMTWNHASELFHAAVNIMRTLGWAWRWAEWWVEEGDNWEPLLEPGQDESQMTDEELKKVKSTPESRRDDARVCRLAAFGAALRNRGYDNEEGDDREPLEKALTAVLSTKSLVGPLKKKEIEFFVTWLSLAYRSKSATLGFGNEKTDVAADGFCIHQDDGSPKHELGTRPLPGKTKSAQQPNSKAGVFEPHVEEPDDFLKTPVSMSPKKKKGKKKNKRSIDSDYDDDETLNLLKKD